MSEVGTSANLRVAVVKEDAEKECQDENSDFGENHFNIVFIS